MPERYTVHYLGPFTTITPAPDGPWPRWEMARAAAIEHIEDQVRECQKTLQVLGRAANFYEYISLRGEMKAREDTEVN